MLSKTLAVLLRASGTVACRRPPPASTAQPGATPSIRYAEMANLLIKHRLACDIAADRPDPNPLAASAQVKGRSPHVGGLAK